MRKRGVGAVMAVMLAGCAAFQAGTPDALQQATGIGQDAADVTCTAVAIKAPADVQAEVVDGLARAGAVLASESITTAALAEALGAIRDDDWRRVAQAGLRVVLRRLSGGEVPADMAKDSPAAVGAAAFVAACQDVLGVRA